MYQKILVPLDGSVMAECSLAHISHLVKTGCAGEVIILNIFWALSYPVVAGVPPASYIEKVRKSASIASLKYLEDVEKRLGTDGIKVKTVSMEGDRPAGVISEYAQINDIDLIIMGTHGYTGLKKIMMGSVALEVLHNSHAPVLLIRAESCLQ